MSLCSPVANRVGKGEELEAAWLWLLSTCTIPGRGHYWTIHDVTGDHVNLPQLAYEDHTDHEALNGQWGLVLYAQ